MDSRLQEARGLYERRKFEAARQLCEALVQSDPCDADALHLLGLLLALQGDYPSAAARVASAISLCPDKAEYFFNLGNIHLQSGRAPEAIRIFRNALALAPDHAEAWFNLGNTLQGGGGLAEAVQCYRHAIRCRPQYLKAQINLANAQRELGEFEAAEAGLRQALQWAPEHATAANNLGNLLREVGKPVEALAHLSAVLSAEKTNYRAWNNYGSALKEAGRLPDAVAAYREALRLKPDHAGAHLNLAMALLAAGDYAEGWREYEWRWQGARENQGAARNFSAPQWQGQPLNGESILLHAEQGLGDALQFVRYAPLVADRGGRVVVECQPELKSLFARIPGVSTAIGRGEALPDFSWHCPLMSLPFAFGTTLPTVPANIPYLRLDAGKVAEWKRRLAIGSNLRVGLVWAGNPRRHDPVSHQIDRRRSLHLSQLAPLLALPGIEICSLQKGEPQSQLAETGLPMADLSGLLQDFDDTAAVVSLLDLVVTVDTSVAHLAGALGRPVWMLSRYDGCWRWGEEGDSTPWYPSMKIYRQAAYGDWAEPLAALCRDLQALGENSDGLRRLRGPASADPHAELLQRAAQLHRAGNAADAEKIYLDVLAKDARHPDALNLLGVLRCQRRRFDEALPFLERAVAAQPEFVDAHNNLGKALKQLDRLGEAEVAFAEAVRLSPDFAEAHNNLGQILKRRRQADAAIRHFRQAIALDPDYALAHLNLADALKESKQADDALTHYRRAIALKPDSAVAHNNLGTFLKDLADTRGAFACLEQAIRIKPDFAEAYNNLGNLHLDESQPEEAIRCYRKALELKPDFAEAANNLGNALKETGRTDDAVAAYRQCLSLKPGFAEAHNNLGNAYLQAERYAEALAQYRKALELDPAFGAAYNNLGSAYQTLGDPENALACYRQAVECKPAFHQALFGRGLMHLLTGDFAPGWRDYEYRWQGSHQARQVRPPSFPYPQWYGQTPLPGSRILVYHEQGFGDTIQFVRYLPLLARQFAETVFVCQKELLPLLRYSMGPAIRLLSSEEGADAVHEKFDWHCPLLSLPLAFQTRGDTIPADGPYLAPPPDKRESWRQRLAVAAPLRVGLAWSGNPQLKDDRQRSIPLARFGRLFALDGISWFSLQKDGSAGEIAQAGLDRTLVDHAGDLADFSDTAAMIANLDLVISVDTAVAHLAGAMGKPVWLLNRHASEWRWQLRRSDSPWYPTMRIFRQPAQGDWDSVLAAVREEFGARRGGWRP